MVGKLSHTAANPADVGRLTGDLGADRLAHMSNQVRRLLLLAAIFLGSMPARGAETDATTLWSYLVPGQGAVEMDLPSTWMEVVRDEESGIVRFRPSDGVKAELTLNVTWSLAPDPDFNGPSRLRSLVEAGASGFLDQAVESRYTIRELRGPHSGGYYWVLRDRAPRKKWAAYVTRGMVGVGTILLDFTLVTPQPDMPEIRQALKMIAGSRLAEPEPEPPTPE